MRNKNNNPDGLIRCSVCESGFSRRDITILEESGQKSIFHVTCSKCGSSTIVIFSSNQNGIVSLGVATDLDKNEVKKMFQSDAISADEVIDAHQLMSNYNGDLTELVKKIES